MLYCKQTWACISPVWLIRAACESYLKKVQSSIRGLVRRCLSYPRGKIMVLWSKEAKKYGKICKATKNSNWWVCWLTAYQDEDEKSRLKSTFPLWGSWRDRSISHLEQKPGSNSLCTEVSMEQHHWVILLCAFSFSWLWVWRPRDRTRSPLLHSERVFELDFMSGWATVQRCLGR